jgi:hypothetical protein
MVVVLRIYLDQNKWIDLARAASGHRTGERFVEALRSARTALSAENVSFPLDLYRYWETTKRQDDRSRNDVIDLMLELARQDTMALAQQILPSEVDAALKRRFGRPETPRLADVFGNGLRHIIRAGEHWPIINLETSSGEPITLPDRQRAAIQRAFDQAFEEALFRSAHRRDQTSGSSDHRTFDERYVDYENAIAANLKDRRLSGEMLEFAVRASDLGDIRSVVTESLVGIGETWDSFIALLGAEGVVEFMDDLPTRYVTNVMRSAKLRQDEQPWEANDFNDILALPVAAVYCDVVITERQWAHRLKMGKVEERFGTVVLSNTTELLTVLATTTEDRR